MKRILLSFALLVTALSMNAQSANFQIGKGLDIQNSILSQLSAYYVDTINFEKLLSTGVNAMLESLDPYTVYYPEENEEDIEMMTTGKYGGIGAMVKKRVGGGVIISQPYPNTPAVKAGLAPGDTIFCIDGKYVYDEDSEASSNRMKGIPGTDVVFKIVKGGSKDTTEVVVTREKIYRSSLQYYGMLRDSIGYIYMTGFTEHLSDEVREAVQNLKKQGAKRLVLDLRGNGGGLLSEAIDIVSLFVPKGTLVVSQKGKNPSVNREEYTRKSPMDTEIPLLIMVDSGSASASEIVAGAIQDLDRGMIGGKRTFGKGLVQSIHPTSFNGSVKLTTAKYYTPSGRCVQAIDYSHRNEDGSVGAIPDSLTHEFRTKNGRIVKDGGGITPDYEQAAPSLGRTAVSLIYNDILGNYALKYRIEHPAIASPADFKLTDAEYEDFIAYAKNQEFDYRSGVQAELNALVSVAKYDGVYDECKELIDALIARADVSKEKILQDRKEEIRPLLEEEIVARYYYDAGAAVVGLKYDEQLYKVLDKWNNF
ncbi:MAG: S41 family peptidase [Bacteroidales bacterium]|nr:S41 family peptidase [Bacteroidales bacterium]